MNLGDTRSARSTPVLADIDQDGDVEIIVTYDTESSMQVDAWSPELACDGLDGKVEGIPTGTLVVDKYRLSHWNHKPSLQTRQSNHLSVTQPLLADLELDGQPELVLTVVDATTDDPHMLSLPLGAGTPTEMWDVTLDRGTQ